MRGIVCLSVCVCGVQVVLCLRTLYMMYIHCDTKILHEKLNV